MSQIKMLPLAAAVSFAMLGLSACVSTPTQSPSSEASQPAATSAKTKSTALQPVAVPAFPGGKAISGRALINELRTIRSGVAGGDPGKMLASFANSPAAAAAKANAQNMMSGNASSGAGMGNIFGSLLSSFGDIALDTLISELSYAAIDQFFAQMTADNDVLAKVTVDIPDLSKSPPAVKKQVMSMAAYLAAIKASGVMIDASQKDFDAAKNSYTQAIDLRRKATDVLAKAILAKDGLEASAADDKARKGKSSLSAADIEFIQSFKDRKPEELLNDFEAQNIALAYVKIRQPELYKNYNLQVRDLKSHYGAYARTAAGAGSMVGFAAMFLKRAKGIFEAQGANSAALLMPMAQQGFNEVLTLVPKVSKTFESGDTMADGSFKVVGKDFAKTQLTAKKALSALDDEGLAQFRSRLISPREGLLSALYKHAPQQAGVVVDRLVSKDARTALARDYFHLEDTSTFNFQNLFNGKVKIEAADKKRFAVDLLNSPLGDEVTGADQIALAKVQKEIVGNRSDYSNSDLRKLLFVTSAKNPQNPRLQLGKYAIQIDTLGIAGLADYDEVSSGSLAQAKLRDFSKDKADKPGKS